MTTAESQDLVLYAPRGNVVGVMILGCFCLSFGIIIHFLSGRPPFLGLLASIFFIIVGIFFGTYAWQMVRKPMLTISAEGICSSSPFSSPVQLKWDEIDAIYCLSGGPIFAVDLSPTGLVSYFSRQSKRIPRYLDITVPNQALDIREFNLPLPMKQLFAQIREHFSVQLERYDIYLGDGDEAKNVLK